MNAMLDRLEESSTRQRRFVSDASHELRSPIAAIRAQVEVAKRRGPAADWPTVADRVLEEDGRLEEAVSELLELAKAEEAAPLEAKDVDLEEIVLEETERERRVPIETSRVSGGRVRGQATQLARVVRNLLDNACRHAASKVAVSLETRGDEVWLVVDDDGPGIAPADRAKVFDRFTRLDEGRARDAGGVGLGLSMVKAIVERHQGSTAIEDSPSAALGSSCASRLPCGPGAATLLRRLGGPRESGRYTSTFGRRADVLPRLVQLALWRSDRPKPAPPGAVRRHGGAAIARRRRAGRPRGVAAERRARRVRRRR